LIVSTLLIVIGLLALVLGGELLVRGASTLAARMRIPPLIIGLTVVAFGTSAPELGVSLQAAMSGAADVAVGNVVGSNIFNVLLILGVSALITPLVVSSQLIRFDVPLMIGTSVLTWVLASDGVLNRTDGAILFSIVVAYTIFSIRVARRESKAVQDEFAAEYSLSQDNGAPASSSWWLQGLLMAGGLICLGVGSNWLVTGAVSIASSLGVSELIIGITIVAAGTSLPEVMTSIVASLRGERDIAVGNVIGSNIFNLSCVLGLSSLVAPEGIAVAPVIVRFDLPVMIAVAAVCLPVFFTGYQIARWEGGLFLAYYLVYMIYLILAASAESATSQMAWVLRIVVLPVTLLTIVASVIWSLRRGHQVE
jgi:cation:H+ antiporter